MRRGFSFRTRVLLSFFLVILLGVLAPSWYLRSVLLDELVREAMSDAERVFALADHVAELDTDAPSAQAAASLDVVAEKLGIAVAVVDSSGSELLTTESAAAWGLDSFSPHNMPDKTGDILDERAFLSEGILRVWRHVPAAGSGRDYWVGMAMPNRNVPEQVNRINNGLLLALGAAILLSGIFSIFLVRWLGRSMDSLITVAEHIGQGHYRERAVGFHSRELDSLSRSINKMAERIEEHIRIITEQKGQFEAVLNSMNEGVMVLDTSCRIISMNRAFITIFPECRDQEGRRPLELISSPELQQACQEVMRDKDERALRTFQIEPRKDSVYDVAIVSLAREDSEPDELGAVAVFHDISTLSRLERVRSDFVANVSHELRTPLTSIKGYAETVLTGLEEGFADQKSLIGFMGVVLRNANHMSKMVNDLLNLARLEGGKNPFEVDEVDAAEALNHALKECNHLAVAQNTTIVNHVEDSGVLVMADKDRLVQVFRNLLENAVKYGRPQDTGDGEEEPLVTIWNELRDDKMLIAIQDNGPGIPKEERKRIFERFYRVEKHRAKDSAGSSGLGLAITKHMVDKMGGEVWVESPAANGRGVTFFVALRAMVITEPLPQGISDQTQAVSS